MPVKLVFRLILTAIFILNFNHSNCALAANENTPNEIKQDTKTVENQKNENQTDDIPQKSFVFRYGAFGFNGLLTFRNRGQMTAQYQIDPQWLIGVTSEFNDPFALIPGSSLPLGLNSSIYALGFKGTFVFLEKLIPTKPPLDQKEDSIPAIYGAYYFSPILLIQKSFYEHKYIIKQASGDIQTSAKYSTLEIIPGFYAGSQFRNSKLQLNSQIGFGYKCPIRIKTESNNSTEGKDLFDSLSPKKLENSDELKSKCYFGAEWTVGRSF